MNSGWDPLARVHAPGPQPPKLSAAVRLNKAVAATAAAARPQSAFSQRSAQHARFKSNAPQRLVLLADGTTRAPARRVASGTALSRLATGAWDVRARGPRRLLSRSGCAVKSLLLKLLLQSG